MHVTSTFRHMDTSAAVRDYTVERLSKLRKYFRREPIAAHAVFSIENGHEHTAELLLTLPNGLLIQSRETTEDMYSSIDLAGARIERQVRRWKDRIRDHKPHGGPSYAVKDRVLHADQMEPGPGKGKGIPAGVAKRAGAGPAAAKGAGKSGRAPAEKSRSKSASTRLMPPAVAPFQVVKEQTFTVRPMRVDDAVMQLNLLESEFLVFNDTDAGTISVVYRRKDGNYGVLDTGAQISAGTPEKK